MTPYYEDGLVTIYHGDAREVMPNVWTPASLVLTDPPYGLGGKYGGQNRSMRTPRSTTGDETPELLWWIASSAAIWTEPDAWVAIFCGWDRAHEVQERLIGSGLRVQTVIVWDKGRFSPVGRGVRDQHEFIVLAKRGHPPTPWDGGNVWRFSRVHAPDHPNEKPETLMRAAITRLLPPADRRVLLDPFIGTGSSLVAAKALGHRAIGIDIEERWCEFAATRCSQEVLGLVAG